MRSNGIVLRVAMSIIPGLLYGQTDFSVAGREVQVHGFASQGFAYSNQNNFLTMNTSQGSFAMTDFGLNATLQVTDKLRVGVQIYDRNVGQLGEWHPLLDYAYADYRLKDWLGVRAGRVKTQLGLYTSTQDADFLRTWALLPQSVYPTDLRSMTIAHDGIDLYGAIPLRGAGSLSYTAYAGARPDDKRSGLYYQFADVGWPPKGSSAWMAGADVRWTTFVPGLTLGISANFQKGADKFYPSGTPAPQPVVPPPAGSQVYPLGGPGPSSGVYGPYRATDAYVDYTTGKLHLAGEYRRNFRFVDVRGMMWRYVRNLSDRAWFASASYRAAKWLEVGAYESRYYVDHPAALDSPYFEPPTDSSYHIFDHAATLRFDLTHSWNLKLEGHFMDGSGDPFAPHGFYKRVNPEGVKPKTTMVVIRTGWTF